MAMPPVYVTPSPLLARDEAPLPPGVARCPQCGPQTTLANCEAVMVTFTAPNKPGTIGYVVWRRRVPGAVTIKPIAKHRITELRPGDRAVVDGQALEVVGLEVWR